MSEQNATVQSDDVLAFLENHPDFLQHHADRFGLRQHGDRVVVSLVDRQMLELKDRNRQLEARLQQLVRHGENNDQIQLRMQQLALTLTRANSAEALASALPQCFTQVFGLDRMALRLWHPGASALGTLFNSRSEISMLARNLSAPYCGPYVNDEIMSWFPAIPVLQSFMQLPLRDGNGEPFGLLVLASDDPERFTHDMHTHYLVQIGELLSATWLRVLAAA